jgi:hypothetical protein
MATEEKLERVRAFIEKAPWREAKTYRYTWPHEYVLREDCRKLGIEDEYNEFVQWYLDSRYPDKFFSITQYYADIDGFTYWGDAEKTDYREHKLINKCKIEESYPYLEKRGLVKKRMAERRAQQREDEERAQGQQVLF